VIEKRERYILIVAWAQSAHAIGSWSGLKCVRLGVMARVVASVGREW